MVDLLGIRIASSSGQIFSPCGSGLLGWDRILNSQISSSWYLRLEYACYMKTMYVVWQSKSS